MAQNAYAFKIQKSPSYDAPRNKALHEKKPEELRRALIKKGLMKPSKYQHVAFLEPTLSQGTFVQGLGAKKTLMYPLLFTVNQEKKTGFIQKLKTLWHDIMKKLSMT